MSTMIQQPPMFDEYPIVDEIRRIRSEIAAEFGNDMDLYFDYLKKQEEKHINEGRFRFVDHATEQIQWF